MRTAFYPCCGSDIREPLRLLYEYADRVVFCDINPALMERWRRLSHQKAELSLPKVEFITGNARVVISELPVIDVLFYRKDSVGEGGGGLFVLGHMFLRPLMERFSLNGGYIFTDGSNSRGGNFEKMIGRNGLNIGDRKLSATPDQPYRSQYGLWRIRVSAAPII